MKEEGKGGASHQALYRKYRPSALKDVVGQQQVTEILRRSLEQGRVAHAYLLTGPKGTGKTSIARILAHEINKLPYSSEETHLDIIEIDAASNNGVDDVRDLREKVQLAPIAASKKVYIIDEVHMLSKPAFNALLKTLEEPPAHVVFILATTDLHKVPPTIISRTQHFAFHSISPANLVAQLSKIAKAEGMKIDNDALAAIADRGDGSFRNSISLLDQLSSFADDKEGITLDLVQTTLGLPPRAAVEALLAAVDTRDIPAVIAKLDELEKTGIQPPILADQLIRALRDRLAEQPQSVLLLDSLLDVSTSPQPQLKILTTLVAAAKPRTAAAAATKPKPVAPTILEAPVIVVEKEVPAPARESSPAEPLAIKSEETLPARDSADVSIAETKSEVVPEDAGSQKTRVKKPASIKDFAWANVVEFTKKDLVALYSVLSKCEVELSGKDLTIYSGRKFNKTKLDQPKYLTQLHEALDACGYGGLAINTLADSKPPEDEQLAKVAAMMGGGKEVPFEEAA